MNRAPRLCVAALLLAALGSAACRSTRLAPIDAGAGPLALEPDERKLWEEAGRLAQHIEALGIIYTNTQLEAYIHAVAMQLMAHRPARPALELKVRILRAPYRTAFVFPNGVLFITIGMLACMDSEAELATLLGHELTHFLHRHSLKEQRSAANKQTFLDVLAGTTLLTGLAPVFAGLGSAWASSVLLGYSRELEAEADETGLELMIAAGYDPRASLRLFECLREEDRLAEDLSEDWPATHPHTHQRAEQYRTLLASRYAHVAEQPGRKLNREPYRQHIRQVLFDNAMLDLEAGRPEFAQRAVDRYIAEWPNCATGYFHRGEIHRRSRHPEAAARAEAAYRQAVRLDPNYAEPRRELGLLLRAAGNLREAREQFAAYVELAPNAVDAGIFRGYVKELDGTLAGPAPP